jgi:signal transduction histidine kinase
MTIFRRPSALGTNILTAAAAMVILLAIAAGSYVFGDRTGDQAMEGLQAGAVDRLSGRILSTLLDAETAQRGYMLTDREDYLTPYRDAAKRFGEQVGTLRDLLSRLPQLGSFPVDRLEAVGREKFEELDETVKLTAAGEREKALALVLDDHGRVIMDEARQILTGIQTRATEFRQGRIAEMRASADVLALLTLLGVLAVIALAALAAATVVQHTRALAAAHAALGKANAELEERVKERTVGLTRANDEVQRYAYIVSHDLRAPLVNIMGFTSELDTATQVFADYLKQADLDAEDPLVQSMREAVETDIPEALGFIRSSMTRMDGLINEILKLSRLGRTTLTPVPIDMADMVAGCVADIQHRLDAAGASVTIEAPLPDVVSDRTALQQIFTNLLDNAVKYLDRQRAGRIVVSGRRLGTVVQIEVADNGRGIQPDDHERVFELFRRSGPQDRPGEGIGLAHVRALVRRLGGDITVDSDGKTGTTFRVIVARDLRLRKGSDER